MCIPARWTMNCARDTLTSPREIERDYLAADAFLEDLDAAGVRLGRFHEFG